MKVETYEQLETELAEHAPEMEAEAIELIESLGLTGQQELVQPNEVGTKTRSPYREMTAEEDRVYSQLCPEKVRVEDYAHGPIPLRVLQIVAHGRELFDFVEVWYSGGIKEKDPILVGRKGKDNWNAKKFILARWGDELDDLEVLRVRAITQWMRKQKASAEKKIREAESFLATLENQAEDFFNGEWVHTP